MIKVIAVILCFRVLRASLCYHCPSYLSLFRVHGGGGGCSPCNTTTKAQLAYYEKYCAQRYEILKHFNRTKGYKFLFLLEVT